MKRAWPALLILNLVTGPLVSQVPQKEPAKATVKKPAAQRQKPEPSIPIYKVVRVLEGDQVVLEKDGREITVHLTGVEILYEPLVAAQRKAVVETAAAAEREATAAKKAAFDKTKFEGVYRAAKAVEGASNSGVNCLKFSELLQSLATELSILSDKISTEQEKELAALYVAVSATYQDSSMLWKAKLDTKYHILEEDKLLLVLQRYYPDITKIDADQNDKSKVDRMSFDELMSAT
ncbi:MAG: hypothetical protein ACR2L2_16150 [Acidobacteriota bacterium]